MKLKRLYQPRNPRFWIVALSLLSAALGWLTHTHEMGVFFSLIIAAFALGHGLLGANSMWRLVKT